MAARVTLVRSVGIRSSHNPRAGGHKGPLPTQHHSRPYGMMIAHDL